MERDSFGDESDAPGEHAASAPEPEPPEEPVEEEIEPAEADSTPAEPQVEFHSAPPEQTRAVTLVGRSTGHVEPTTVRRVENTTRHVEPTTVRRVETTIRRG